MKRDLLHGAHTKTLENLPAVAVTPRVSLVVQHPEGAEFVPLAPGARLLIGRSVEADLAIPEPTLSRQHCRIELNGEELWIEDLNSHNGTHVNGAPMSRCRLYLGDTVTLGTRVTLTVHAVGSSIQGLEQPERFMVVLREEFARCRTFEHPLALLVIRLPDTTDSQWLAGWCTEVRQLLRPFDRLALHSPGVATILLLETERVAAIEQAHRMIAAGRAKHCALALLPRAQASSAEELVQVALGALAKTSATQPVVVVGGSPAGESAKPNRSPEAPLELIGQAMREVYATVARVAVADLPVLICGETGSGKEVVARAIHQRGPRRERPMRCINCGAIPRELVQSILFGHERGAFTGAVQPQEGLFQAADGSTLLLDEIGELPPEAQVALLRVLETGRVARLGSSRERSVDVRVISATHRDLEAMCETGAFRWDLYYRLNTVTLRVPPLRERLDEILPLAEYFVSRASAVGGTPPKRIDPLVYPVLRRYAWPGNVRELRNAMERAVLVAAGSVITASDLPARICAAAEGTMLERAIVAGPGAAEPPSPSEEGAFKRKVAAFESRLLARALARCGWNKTAAARALRMPLRTLMYKVQAYGLQQRRPWQGKESEAGEAGEARDEGKARAELNSSSELDFKELVRRYEEKLLSEALREAAGNRTHAARLLGLPLSTVLYKLRAYRLDASD